MCEDSNSTPTTARPPSPGPPQAASQQLPSSAQSSSPHVSVGDGDSSPSSQPSTAKRGRRSSRNSVGEEPRAPRKNRLQDEHQRMLNVERNLVKRIIDRRGAAGFSYKCLKCGVVKRERLRAIGHAANCGKRKAGKKRGKSTRILRCNLCEETATTVEKLTKHRREAHPDVLGRTHLQCTRCLKTFSYLRNYKNHLKFHKQGKGYFNCKTCPKTFLHLRNLKRHELTHLEQRQSFPCETCGAKFDRRDNLKRHMLRHEQLQVRFKCPSCPMEYSREDALLRHRTRDHPDLFESPIMEFLRASGHSEREVNLLLEKYRRLNSSATPHPLSSTPSVSGHPSSNRTLVGEDSNSASASASPPPSSSTSPIQPPPSSDGPALVAQAPNSATTGSVSKWDKFLPPPPPLKPKNICDICGDSRPPFRDSHDLNRHKRSVHGEGLS